MYMWRRTLLISTLCAICVMVFTANASCQAKNLAKLGRRLSLKPVNVLTNIKLSERWQSLFQEMRLKDYNLVRLQDANFEATDMRRATFFIIVDRERGPMPDRLTFLIPQHVRRAPPQEGEAVLGITRNPGRFVIYVSAPNSALAYRFFDTEIRNDKSNFSWYEQRGSPKRCYMEWIPSAPEIVFPNGEVRATRPRVFLVYPKSKYRPRFDIQMARAGRMVDYDRKDFPTERNAFQTEDGGWIAFGRELREARRYELEQWRVELSREQRESGLVVYTYQPAFDVEAGETYELRGRAVYYGGGEEARTVGEWSSVDAQVSVQIPPQPANLPSATRVTATEDVSELAAAYSPDGKYILYSADRTAFGLYEIYMSEAARPASGATRVSVTNRGSSDRQPSWGPVHQDGTSFASFSRAGQYGAETVGTQIWCVGVPTSEHPRVPAGYTRVTSFEQDCYAPAWSPDGQKLAYVKDAERGGAELWLVSLEGTNKVLVQGITPAWSKDGRSLYYSSNANGTWDIWRIDLDTGQQTAITSDAGAEFAPSVNPVSGDVAYVSSAEGNFDVWVASGAGTRHLTQWLGQDLDPAWDPTGQYITYSTTRFSSGGTYDLATINPYRTGISPAQEGAATGEITLPTPDN